MNRISRANFSCIDVSGIYDIETINLHDTKQVPAQLVALWPVSTVMPLDRYLGTPCITLQNRQAYTSCTSNCCIVGDTLCTWGALSPPVFHQYLCSVPLLIWHHKLLGIAVIEHLSEPWVRICQVRLTKDDIILYIICALGTQPINTSTARAHNRSFHSSYAIRKVFLGYK